MPPFKRTLQIRRTHTTESYTASEVFYIYTQCPLMHKITTSYTQCRFMHTMMPLYIYTASWVKKLCVKKAMLYVCMKRGCGVSIRHSSVCKAFLCVYKASLCVDVRFPCLFVSGALVHSRRRWSAYAIVMCVVHHGINTLHVTIVYVPSGTFSSDFNEQFSELIGVLLSLPGKHVIVGDF